MNMTHILLVARREFAQITALKSFWLTLLILPIALGLGSLMGKVIAEDEATKVTVVDQSGGEVSAAIERHFGLEEDRARLRSLSRYVQRYALERADPQAPWSQHDRWYTDSDVAAFRAAGGIDGAMETIDRVKPEETPAYEPAEPKYEFVSPPPTLLSADALQLDGEVEALLANAEDQDSAQLILAFGPDYPSDPSVRLWSNEQPSPSFVTNIQNVLTADLRQRLLTSRGLSPDEARAVQTAAPAILVTTPEPGGGAREALLIRSIVPLGLAYVLMVALMLSGSWMLQGAVEERSNKLLESLLACIRPEELMYGKLLGAVAVGLCMLLAWLGCAAVAVFVLRGEIADMIRPALAPVNSPEAIAAIIYFFLAGYIAVSIMFVAIGALANSMSEAQGYLMPVLLAILLPITFLIQMIAAGKSGILMSVLTWIPLWSPFAVLARLGTGIAVWEMVLVGLMLAGFIMLEIVFLGRLFRASLLADGQKPGIKQLLERLRPIRE